MALTINGNWTVTISYKQPGSLPSRLIVNGATTGNGVYDGYQGLSFPVTGTSWQITIQGATEYDPPYVWVDSSMRKTNVINVSGLNTFNIESEDLIQDNTWDDLILRLTQPAPVIVTPPPVTPPVIPPVVPPVINPPVIVDPPPPPPPIIIVQPGKVYTRFNPDERLPREQLKITEGMWLDITGSKTGNLLTYYTGSNDTGSYKISVFNTECFECPASLQFDIWYGHYNGYGTTDLGGKDYYSPSNAVYSKYSNICLESSELFRIGNNNVEHFYAIRIPHNRFGDKLDEGNVELNIAALSGSEYVNGGGNKRYYTGSNVTLSGNGKLIRLIDDSVVDLTKLSSYSLSTDYQHISSSLVHPTGPAGNWYYMISGSLEDGPYSATSPHVYGFVYPSNGLIILDAARLDASASFMTVDLPDHNGDNMMKLFKSISGSALYTDASGDHCGFKARKMINQFVETYFVRVKNYDYNFTNNPTFVTGSDQIIHENFIDTPLTYITTVGLYNDQYELLAVGKLSTPIQKSFTDETLLEINLCW